MNMTCVCIKREVKNIDTAGGRGEGMKIWWYWGSESPGGIFSGWRNKQIFG